MFENLEPKPADAILKLIGEHRNDPRPEKIDLGVGVYRDADGNTPILKTVKKAEHWLVGSQSSKAYLGSRGDAEFCRGISGIEGQSGRRPNLRKLCVGTRRRRRDMASVPDIPRQTRQCRRLVFCLGTESVNNIRSRSRTDGTFIIPCCANRLE